MNLVSALCMKRYLRDFISKLINTGVLSSFFIFCNFEKLNQMCTFKEDDFLFEIFCKLMKENSEIMGGETNIQDNTTPQNCVSPL